MDHSRLNEDLGHGTVTVIEVLGPQRAGAISGLTMEQLDELTGRVLSLDITELDALMLPEARALKAKRDVTKDPQVRDLLDKGDNTLDPEGRKVGATFLRIISWTFIAQGIVRRRAEDADLHRRKRGVHILPGLRLVGLAERSFGNRHIDVALGQIAEGGRA